MAYEQNSNSVNNDVAGFNNNLSGSDLTVQIALATINGFNEDTMNSGNGSIASATTTDIGGQTQGRLDVTGTTTIVGFGTIPAGIQRVLTFTGILTLAHHATSLILPTGANIITAVGDSLFIHSLGSGNWKVVAYQRADGTALVGGGSVSVEDDNVEIVASASTFNFTGAGVNVTDGGAGQADIAISGGGGGGVGTLDYMHVKLSGVSGNLSVGSVIPYATVVSQDNTNGLISFATNQVTLQAGNFKLSGKIRCGDSSGDVLQARWYDITGAGFISEPATSMPMSSGQNTGSVPEVVAYVSPSSANVYELRAEAILGTPNVEVTGTYLEVEERSTSGGSISVEDDAVEIVASATKFNFIGSGVNVADFGNGQADITISGGGAGSFNLNALFPASTDITTDSLTLTNTDQTITIGPGDTNPIVPEEARWVQVGTNISFSDTSAGKRLIFRHEGATLYHHFTRNYHGVASVFVEEIGWVYIGTDHILNYKGDATIENGGSVNIYGWAGDNATPELDGYVMAGFSTVAIQDNDQYVRFTDAWTAKTSLIAPARLDAHGTTISGKGYIFGGQGGGDLQDNDEYSPDAWTAKTNMPAPAREAVTATTLGVAGYVFGGRHTGGATFVQDNDEYTPDAWVSKTDIPTPARAFSDSSNILAIGYLFGGGSAGGQLNDNDEYNPDTWTGRTNMLSTKTEGGATTINDKIYHFNGNDGAQSLDTDEYVFDTWTNKTNTPAPARQDNSAFTIGQFGYTTAGTTGSNIQDHDEYDQVGDSWASKTSMITPARRRHAGMSI